IPVIVQSLKWDSARHGPTICAAFLRTGGLGTGTPHETPPMRQTSASLELPRMDINASVATADGAIVGQHGLRPLEDSGPESKQNSNFEAASGEEDRRRNNELLEKAVNTSLSCMTTVYDALTLPLYFFVQQPWKQMALHNAPKGILLDEEKMIYGSATPRSLRHQELLDMNIDTMEKVLSYSVAKHANQKCLGAREVIEEVEVMDPTTGKMVKKFELGDYQWMNYVDVNEEATNVSAGLAKLGLKPKQKIAIFAETRREWLITAMAAFKQNLTIVTVFTTLGDDGVIYALKETDVTFLITSEELMPRLVNVLPQVPSVQNLIYMNPRNLPQTESVLAEIPKNVQTTSYSDLVESGKTATFEEVKPTRNDRAIIMYTSGSTGNPKGVILSHNNIVSGMRSVLDILALSGQPEPEDAYIAYLPLAHVLELMSETICFIQGIPIGYSSPLTMTDASLGVKEGTKGDASVLKPTILAGVPLVLERISKGIQTKMAERGKIVELIFNYFYNYKVKWYHKGYDTPLVNKILFNKVKSLIGGRVRFMAVGSAPLAPETHEFIRAVLSCPIVLGYAMTETSSCGTLGIGSDLTVGRVGGPVQCTKIRLVDWEEGGYRITDKPYPRGEIIMGGDNIAMGYYKNLESTDFYEEDGTRWIKTGDIGEVHPDGVFKVIDRKKDLVKLSNGEYISLGKIESIIKTCKYVENACVCADSSHSYPVALICISQPHVKKLAAKMGIVNRSFDDLCRNPILEEAILNKVQSHVVLHNLNKFEVPKKIHLVSEPWMPQSGLVTAAFKIKRNNVYKQYEAQINEMYNSYR
ncbi:Long-chain-fatty-acid--CoA ligase 4, partial [Orchesella cincta]